MLVSAISLSYFLTTSLNYTARMNAVLLLLQLVVATGAAAQCAVLSEVSSAASSAAASLATASDVAVRRLRPCCA